MRRHANNLICRNCGQGFHRSPWNVRKGARFCSRRCMGDWVRKKNSQTCLVCHKSFVAQIKRRHPLCSFACAAQYRKATPIGGAGHKTGQQQVCRCGKTFYAAPSLQRKYCSKRCAVLYSHTRKWPRDGDYFLFICARCGTEFRIHYLLASRQRKFCSKKCAWRRGSLNPLWRGDRHQERGVNWPEMSAAARDRDRHRCQVCGKEEAKGQKLDVDHIIPYRLVLRNDLVNLLSICKAPCHARKTTTAERAFLRGDFLGFRGELNKQHWPMDRVEAAVSWWGTL